VEASWDAYIHPDNVSQFLLTLNQALPDHTQMVDIGSSFEGRTIWALRIGGADEIHLDDEETWTLEGEAGSGKGNDEGEDEGENAGEDRDERVEGSTVTQDVDLPRVLIVGGHHGQEWMAVMPPLHFAWTLVNGYGYNETLTDIVDSREIWIIPVLNMDGMAWDMDQGAADWRKNRQPNPDGSIGTDLNRNYPYHWGEPGMNTPIPSTVFYQGPPDLQDNDGDLLIDEDKVDGYDNDLDGKVDEDRNGGFSAPTTKALGELATDHPPVLALSFHTAGAVILYPWSYSYSSTQDDALFQALAGRMADMTGYEPMQGSDLYPSAGEWGDYMYGVHGTFAFTIELLDQSGGDEYAPPEEIKPTVELVLPLQIAVAQWADDPGQVMD